MTYSPILPFVRRLKIVDKHLRTVTLGRTINWPQVELIRAVEEDMRDGRPIRYITLKARQVGISTITEALAFQWAFCLNRERGLIVSHTDQSTKHLLDMTHHYWDSWWAAPLYRSTSSARDRLAWDPTKSSITVLPAKSFEGARSRTLHFVHASEVAFWPKAREMMKALQQGVPRSATSAIFLESTANGVGDYFHEMWESAKRGDTEFKPMFFAWWRHPEYRAGYIGRGEDARKLLLAKQVNGGTLDDEEWLLVKRLAAAGVDEAEIRERLIWRRSTIATELSGNLDDFHQEYPATDDEAFLSTGRNVFNVQYLRSAYEPWLPERGILTYDSTAERGVRFIPDPEGPLFIYLHPADDPRAWYMVGIDNSKATMFGDYSVAQVIYRPTMEQCAVFRDRGATVNQVLFAEQMILLGRYYNTAMLAPEYNMNGAGINALIEAKYPRYYRHRKAGKMRGIHDDIVGWPMTEQTKAECIANLQREVFAAFEGRSDFIIHDELTYYEMKNYIIDEKGKYANAKQAEHDDTVTSLAIAVSATVYERAGLPMQQFADPALARQAPRDTPMTADVRAGIRNVGEAQGSLDVAAVGQQNGRGVRLPPPVNPFADRHVDLYSDGEDWGF